MKEISSLQFENPLKEAIAQGISNLYNASVTADSISLQETKKEFSGDVTLVVFPFTKFSNKTPEVTAFEIGNYLLTTTFPLESFNVVKGFLNLVISEHFWKYFFTAISANTQLLFDPGFIRGNLPAGYLMVEYSSPNTNKPLHLGHIRNNLLGFSVAQILKANGHKVVMVNLINDRGVHICKSMLAWEKWGNNETPESTGTKGDHLVGKYYVLYDKKYKEQVELLVKQGKPKEDAEKNAPLQLEIQEMLLKWEAGDPHVKSLWKTMNNWVYKGFEESYNKLGVRFDKIYYESETYLFGKKIVEEGLKENVFIKAEDNSVRIDLTDVGLDQKVLLRSDGTSVYITQDLGTAQLRFDENPGLEKLIYVVGNEQEYHFKVLKEIFHKMKRTWWDGLYHLSYGMVDLPSGKMKSREGTVVDADDLIFELIEQAEMATKAQGKLDDFDSPEAKELYHSLGMGALKYFILKVDPKKRMLFNPAESIDLNGNTGPFIQYTYARIKSVLRKGGELINQNKDFTNYKLSEEEKKIIKTIYQYPNVVREAGLNYSPALIANYGYEMAKAFNHFYHDHVIVDENDLTTTGFRLAISKLTSIVILESMNLLGIRVPERM